MKRFRFRLEPVIRYRQYLERLALIELARAKQDLSQTKKKIQEMQQNRKDAATELDSRQAEGMKANRYRIHTDYLQGLSDRIESENERLVGIGRTIKERHQAAETERIKKETLEWVRQSEYTKHVQRINRAEQKAADELVSLRLGSCQFEGRQIV